jgi:hypothetical protein
VWENRLNFVLQPVVHRWVGVVSLAVVFRRESEPAFVNLI